MTHSSLIALYSNHVSVNMMKFPEYLATLSCFALRKLSVLAYTLPFKERSALRCWKKFKSYLFKLSTCSFQTCIERLYRSYKRFKNVRIEMFIKLSRHLLIVYFQLFVINYCEIFSLSWDGKL